MIDTLIITNVLYMYTLLVRQTKTIRSICMYHKVLESHATPNMVRGFQAFPNTGWFGSAPDSVKMDPWFQFWYHIIA
jgi:hypothetical protein